MVDSEEIRLKSVENRVAHLDETMSKLAQNQASMQATIESTSINVDRLVSRVNQPNNVNWWALIGAVGVVVTILGGFMNMRMSPLEGAQNVFGRRLAQHSDNFAERGAVMRANQVMIEDIRTHISNLWKQEDAIWSELRRLSREAAAADASRYAIGEHLRIIDKYGSREWGAAVKRGD